MRRKYKYRVDFLLRKLKKRQLFGQCVKRSFSQAWRDTFGNVKEARDFDALVNAFMLWSQSKSYKICARFLDKYFVNLNACLRRAFLSFCLSRDWAQVFCFSKPKSFHGTDIAGDEQAPTLAWAIFELPLTYPTYSQVQKLDRTARMWASRQIESAYFAVEFFVGT